MRKKVFVLFGLLIVLLGVATVLWRNRPGSSAPAAPAALSGGSSVTNNTSVTSPSGASPDATFAGPKFINMSGRDRRLFLRELGKRDINTIFHAMLDAQRVDHDPLKQMAVRSVLGDALRDKSPSPSFLAELRAFVTDGSNSNFERKLVIGALESASTPATVDLLTQIAASSPEKDIREACGALVGVGGLGRGGEEVTPVLERAWRETRDPDVITSTSLEMAKIGTPSSIDLLLAAALAPEGAQKVRSDAALHALEVVYRPNAVPALVSRLGNQAESSPVAKLVVPILVRIGDVTAGKAVTDWLREQNEDATPFVYDLIVQQTLNPPMLDAWKSALDPAIAFSNQRNKDAIRTGLAAYRAGHVLQR